MAPKRPAIMFYPGDWMKDPCLRRCSPAARGVFIDLLCLMHEMPTRGVLRDASGAAWSAQDASDAIQGAKVEHVDELVDKGVVRRSRREHILFSARMLRDHREDLAQRRAKASAGVASGKARRKQRGNRPRTDKEHERNRPRTEGGTKVNSSSSSSISASATTPQPPGGGQGGAVVKLLERCGVPVKRIDPEALNGRTTASVLAHWGEIAGDPKVNSVGGVLWSRVVSGGEAPPLSARMVVSAVNAGIVTAATIAGDTIDLSGAKHNGDGVSRNGEVLLATNELDQAEYA